MLLESSQDILPNRIQNVRLFRAMLRKFPYRLQLGGRKQSKKTGVALLIRHRGHCEPLWAVVPPLQVVLSSACSVASLGRFPSHYLPGRPRLRMGVLADHLFGWGIPSTRQAGHATVHSASSVKSPYAAQGGMTLPNENTLLSKQFEPNNIEIEKSCLALVLAALKWARQCKNWSHNSTATGGMGKGQSCLHLRYLCSIIRRQFGAIVLDAIAIDLIVAV